MLYHLLPIVFWLLAVGGSVVPLFYLSLPVNYIWGYLVCALVLTGIMLIGRIKRHTSSVEECFLVAVLFGIASYWLPTVLFLTFAVWGYLIYQNLFNFRSFLSTVIGYSLVAIWTAVAVQMQWIANPWADFFAKENAWGWIPTGALLLGWLASTIARQTLRVR